MPAQRGLLFPDGDAQDPDVDDLAHDHGVGLADGVVDGRIAVVALRIDLDRSKIAFVLGVVRVDVRAVEDGARGEPHCGEQRRRAGEAERGTAGQRPAVSFHRVTPHEA